MIKEIIPDRFKKEYKLELAKLFHLRINLFCYVAICVFLLEVLLGSIFFKHLLSVKDMPGIIGGLAFAILSLVTGNITKKLWYQKARALLFSFILISIAILAAIAHPEIMSFMGIGLVLIALFMTILLLPWSLIEAVIIGMFTLVSFIMVYISTNVFVSAEILGINSILLFVAVFIAVIAKASEDISRRKIFAAGKEIDEKSALMAKELELAKKIHKSIIPHSVNHKLADIAVMYKPMFYMGGDYAKFHFINNDKLLFIVADVTGHGVCSALLVNRVHAEIERLARGDDLSPGAILKELDEFINKDFGKMGFFLTAFCGLLDFSNNKLIYSNYGHPPQILLQSKENSIVLMQPQTFLMGIGMDASSIHNNDIAFAPGDRLILFTDGIIEARDSSKQEFGSKRLEDFVQDNNILDVETFNEALMKKLDDFQLGVQDDDVFLLTIQTKEQ
ncbi:MAG: PP2C family protein-serine/threonine phosphatase [Candidatus Orphnella occulta]|nr:PP2C family protein-serine/threonine phosphatase [Candidatus Orphnella occulta]